MIATVLETVWIPTTDDSDVADAVMIAANVRYMRKLEMEATMEAMRKHMGDCRAIYITAWDMDLWLGQETAMGMKWGKR